MSLPLFVWGNEPGFGLLLEDGSNGEMIVHVVKSNGSRHTPTATVTIEPYRRLRVSNFAVGVNESAEYRCECCGVNLEGAGALWLEDATLCHPCSIELGYLVRANPDADDDRLHEMYKLRERKASRNVKETPQ